MPPGLTNTASPLLYSASAAWHGKEPKETPRQSVGFLFVPDQIAPPLDDDVRRTLGRRLSVLNLCSAKERHTMHVKSEVVALTRGGWGSRMTEGDKGPRAGRRSLFFKPMRGETRLEGSRIDDGHRPERADFGHTHFAYVLRTSQKMERCSKLTY